MERNNPDRGTLALQRMEQIERCLMDLLLTIPYQRVNVSQICRSVGISRVTFYQYYESKEDCMNSIIDHLFRDAMIYLNGSIPASASSLEICTMMLSFWKSKKDLIDVLSHNELFPLVLDRAIRFAMVEDFLLVMPLEFSEKERDRDILASYAGSQIAMLTQWYFRGFDTPSEEMAKKYLYVLQGAQISTQRKQQQNTIL